MMKRREFMSMLGCAAAVWPLAARAQSGKKWRKVGVLHPGQAATANAPSLQLREGLNDSLWGRSALSWSFGLQTESCRLPALATDLVNDRVDMIVALTFTPCGGTRRRRRIFLLWRLLRPIRWPAEARKPCSSGRQRNGVFLDVRRFGAKCVELFRVYSTAFVVGVLGPTPGHCRSGQSICARGIGIEIFPFRGPGADIGGVFAVIAQIQGELVFSCLYSAERVADVAVRTNVPTISVFPVSGGVA